MPRARSRSITKLTEIPVAASANIAEGDLVMLVGGYATPAAANASTQQVCGVATKAANNSSGSAGDISVVVAEGVFTVSATGMAQTDVGAYAFASSGVLVSGTQGANEPYAGLVKRYRSATLVDIEVSHQGNYNAAAGSAT